MIIKIHLEFAKIFYLGEKVKHRAFIFIILAGIMWGTSGIFVHMLEPFGFSSLHMTFFRAIVAFLSMAVYTLLKDKNAFRVKLKELILYFFIGLSFFGTASCYYFSMQATSISTAVVLMYLAPVIVMIYSVMFMGEKMTALKTVSLLAMMTGCCFVSGIIGGLRFDFFGIAMGVLSGISYAAYNIFTKIAMKNKCNEKSVIVFCFLSASLISLCCLNPIEIIELINKDVLLVLPMILGLGIITCVLPYFLYTLALKELNAGTASALGIVEPMSATVFSVLIFHEELTIFPLIGIILIIGATLLLSRCD